MIKKAALTLLVVGAFTFANAQKIAHISLDSLVSMMPETKTAKDVAQKYLKDLETTVGQMEEELQKKYNDYLAGEAGMSDLVKKTKQDELNSLQRRIEDFRMQAQQDYQRKYGELTAPIMDKAKKGIEAVAKEGGYKYVLDTSVGNVLYSEPAEDILMPVKKKLDAMPLANIPGANTNTDKPKTTPAPNKTGGK
ncbi:MAG TPA: OmpH family outer membrane protein [Bacteroidia bacterium]|nr:OmpH family outer membrane protein [Bacteroidia bacterium]HRD37033.1 OmpH family outer membrane protein [Bacteroidia bacterium]